MHVSRSLVQWYFRAAWFVTLPAAGLAAAFVLGYSERLAEAVFLPFLLIAVHSLLAAWSMCRFETPAAGFLYTRGFSRDRLWVHRILAHLLSVLVVWGLASLLVWLGVRSAFQDHLIENPYYPLMKSADFATPWWWLAEYLLLLGAVAYGPIRRAQPTCDRDAGHAITVGILIALMTLNSLPQGQSLWFAALYAAVVGSSIALFVGSWRLHREIEVRP